MRNLWLVMTATALALSGCATVKGIGKDVQSVGEAGQKVIDQDKKK